MGQSQSLCQSLGVFVWSSLEALRSEGTAFLSGHPNCLTLPLALGTYALYRNWEYLCGQENVTRWSHGTSVRKCQPGATHGNPWEVLKKRSPIRAFLKPIVRGRNPFKVTLWCHQTWRKSSNIPYKLELYSRGNHRNWRISHCQCATSAPAASEYRINPWCLKGIRPYLSC